MTRLSQLTGWTVVPVSAYAWQMNGEKREKVPSQRSLLKLMEGIVDPTHASELQKRTNCSWIRVGSRHDSSGCAPAALCTLTFIDRGLGSIDQREVNMNYDDKCLAPCGTVQPDRGMRGRIRMESSVG